MTNDYFNQKNIKTIDYKDLQHLKGFVNPNGRLLSRKRTGLSAKHQRQVEAAVKRARFMGLMAFITR